MFKKIMTSVFLILMCINTHAQNEFSISFGQVNLGEKRIKINLKNFKVIKKQSNPLVATRIIKNSTQWIRTKDNLLAPRAMVSVSVKSDKSVSYRYLDKNIIPEGQTIKSSKLYVNIYNPMPIEIYIDGKKSETLYFQSRVKQENKKGHLIDYSCSRYSLNIQGLDDQYLSIGCRMQKLGKIGSERNQLIITMATPNYMLKSGHSSPFSLILTKNEPVQINLVNQAGQQRTLKLKANFSKRSHRLKLALGFGPYSLKSSNDEKEAKEDVVPAFMLYGKWDLLPGSSLRFFDAVVAKQSIFNNGGLYFAYEIARVMDNRVKVVPLLGAQILTYKFSNDYAAKTRAIYPQGVEVSFSHFLGFENLHMVGGIFVSTSSKEDYTNSWIRWGRKYFWELNYIHWAHEDEEVSTWGLSVGIPIGSYF